MRTSDLTQSVSARFVEILFFLFSPFNIRSYLESDVEEFEDNPEEYIRKDIEKSGRITLALFIIQLFS